MTVTDAGHFGDVECQLKKGKLLAWGILEMPTLAKKVVIKLYLPRQI